MTLTTNERKAELVRRGVQMQTIAERAGVSLSLVSKIIAGQRRNPRVERAIAREMALPVEQVFGIRAA